ncbi:MAG: Tautomerase enzyme [Chthonomonadales bacterium]|nr:Tautomerase enzyme [Chthonomonadales bacterium]
MAQVKIYGLAEHLELWRSRLSDVIHSFIVDALRLPVDKRFHRFFPMDAADFRYPSDRTTQYTIIEISLFEGRSVERKKQLIRLLFERLARECAIAPQDLEITLTETPRSNWGIRGLPADELGLSYSIESE